MQMIPKIHHIHKGISFLGIKFGAFLRTEAAGGIVLMLASLLAFIIANSPLSYYYNYFFSEVDFRIGFSDLGDYDFILRKPLILWINDGLMAIFFFLVSLEIKRAVFEGALSSFQKVSLPALAAFGGIAAPALIYAFFNMGSPETQHGWAIPAATDIAFALGVLALLGSRAPLQLKVLLTAIAVIDDLAAIIIIALFYSGHIYMEAIVGGAVIFGLLFALNRFNVTKIGPYIVLAIILWLAVLKSGVHATLAGVIVAFFIPLHDKENPEITPCHSIEKSLHPWVAFLILPLFGFANAGVSLEGLGLEVLTNPVTLGIALGLLIGKQLGVFSFIWLAVKLGISKMPDSLNWRHIYALSLLCGIGFTMSLFIGGLALNGREMQASVRLGVLIGSIGSATLAYIVLRIGKNPSQESLQEKPHQPNLAREITNND